jgi:uncharacterized protein (DUF58 family)
MRFIRVSSIFAPSLGAWLFAVSVTRRSELTRAVAQAFGPIVLVLGAVVALRIALVVAEHRRAPRLADLDILTGTGAWLSWCSALAVVFAVTIGWASLAVLGVLGTALFGIVLLHALIALRRGPLVRGSIRRRFSPVRVKTGESVDEEIILEDVHVPIGFRLLVTGRVGPRFPTIRHVVPSYVSGAELVLRSEIGPAVRGDHEAEPLEVWVEDVFGICRSPSVHVGQARLVVLPDVPAAEDARPLLERGLGARMPKPRAPTEGAFRLREYRDGDDVRRIHWVRSFAAQKLVVRLPDESPPDQPRVRLVLDTFFPEAFALESDLPAEMLDAMVAAWLGAAAALARKGVVVTLVMAGANGEVLRQTYEPRAPMRAHALGAKAAWQTRTHVDALLTTDATFVVARAVLTHVGAENIRFILVTPPPTRAPAWPLTMGARATWPVGHPENRWSHRRRLIAQTVRARQDHERANRIVGAGVTAIPANTILARLDRGALRWRTVA